MIAVDTNILVRYYMQDDERQSEQARKLLDSPSAELVFVSVITVVELVWVLHSNYRQAREEIVAVLFHMLRSRKLLIQNEPQVIEAAEAVEEQGSDFADALMGALGVSEGCSATLTFDKRAARLPQFKLLLEE